jgi:hypothetical protein
MNRPYLRLGNTVWTPEIESYSRRFTLVILNVLKYSVNLLLR